ncbi:MAG: hypothetical protein ABIG11_04805, partial [bacterium]
LGPARVRVTLSAPGVKPVSRETRFQVIREKCRVMYLCGRPSAEYAALREFLKADPNLELVSFIILRNPENISPVPDSELSLIPFPADDIFSRDLRHFDIFMLQDFDFSRFRLPLAYMVSLKKFVRDGGSLFVSMGENSAASGWYRGTELEEILPVTVSTSTKYSREKITVSPLEHPVSRLAENMESSRKLWNEAASLDGFTRFASVRPGSRLILEGSPAAEEPAAAGTPSSEGANSRLMKGAGKMPLLAVREYGKGKVMVLASPTTWRWKLEAGRARQMAGFYQAFWTKVMQYLNGSLELRRVQLTAPVRDTGPGPAPVLSLRVLDETFNPLNDPSADIKAWLAVPSGKKLPLEFRMTEPGIFKTELDPPDYGMNRAVAAVKSGGAVIGTDEISFRLERPSEQNRSADRAFLQRLARRCAGRYASLQSVPVKEWLEALPERPAAEDVKSKKELWDSGAWLAAAILLLTAEWFLRRLWGFL